MKNAAVAQEAGSAQVLQSEILPPSIDTRMLTPLLKDFTKLAIKSATYTPTACGSTPESRKMSDYLKYGIINLDKPSGPSSHEVVSYVKKILNVERVGHSGTLDPAVSGCLLTCLERATRLVKSEQEMGKCYVSILQFNEWESYYKALSDEEKQDLPLRVNNVAKILTAPELQRPPAEGCAVKRVLRVREIYKLEILEFDQFQGRILFKVDCQSGTYIRVLCQHFGYLFGCDAVMAELRRVRSGCLTENMNFVTLHDVLDAFYLYEKKQDESYLRKVVMPLEVLLQDYKKVIVKDSAVDALTYGAQLLIEGVLRYSPDIQLGDAIVLVSTKGEAVALAQAKMGAVDIAGLNHGVVCKPTRVIMDRDVYLKQWGKGEMAIERKRLIGLGLLEKDGAVNDKTPAEWKARWQNTDAFVAQAGSTCANGKFTLGEQEKCDQETERKPEVEESQKVEKKSKHEGETEEERLARKAAKKAEKESKKESKKDKKHSKKDE